MDRKTYVRLANPGQLDTVKETGRGYLERERGGGERGLGCRCEHVMPERNIDTFQRLDAPKVIKGVGKKVTETPLGLHYRGLGRGRGRGVAVRWLHKSKSLDFCVFAT